MGNIWAAYSGSFHKKGDQYGICISLPLEILKKKKKTKNKELDTMNSVSLLQSIPLPQLASKEKAPYIYYKTGLNFLSKSNQYLK